MNFFDTLQDATQQERQTLFSLPIIRDALEGKVSLESYREFLAQAYYHVRHTVPLMMACWVGISDHHRLLRIERYRGTRSRANSRAANVAPVPVTLIPLSPSLPFRLLNQRSSSPLNPFLTATS